MIHPDTELRFVNDVIGHGVFATRDIPRGTITWVRDAFDRAFAPGEVAALSPVHRRVLDRYAYEDGTGATILCWDFGRYVNHSCDPTCLAPGWDLEVALRDIPAGTELTDDYGSLGSDDPAVCRCGSAACRGGVRVDDIDRMADVWDGRVAAVLPRLRSVAQPLWDLVRERERIVAALDGRLPIPSIRVHRPPRPGEPRPAAGAFRPHAGAALHASAHAPSNGAPAVHARSDAQGGAGPAGPGA